MSWSMPVIKTRWSDGHSNHTFQNLLLGFLWLQKSARASGISQSSRCWFGRHGKEKKIFLNKLPWTSVLMLFSRATDFFNHLTDWSDQRLKRFSRKTIFSTKVSKFHLLSLVFRILDKTRSSSPLLLLSSSGFYCKQPHLLLLAIKNKYQGDEYLYFLLVHWSRQKASIFVQFVKCFS